MIKEDAREVEKMKQALGDVDKSADRPWAPAWEWNN